MYYTNNISSLLLNWYEQSKRNLPWRNTKDPYKIWVSEIMLQQTQVNTVIPYYKKWIIAYPTINSLAETDSDSILKLWEGLGYYNRCLNLHKAVKIIVSNYGSSLPNNPNVFETLPGVGEYTAAAVYSIAFSHQLPVLDGNVKRVLSRILKICQFTRHNKNRILSKLKSWIDKNNPGDFNQAMMELGSTVCLPKTPNCRVCPLKSICKGFDTGRPESYPLPNKQKPIPWYLVLTGIIWKNNSFLILQRTGYRHLTNLWELPGGKIQSNQNPKLQLTKILTKKYNLKVSIQNKIGCVNHQYSHFGINLTCFNCKVQNGSGLIGIQPYRWIKQNEINEFAFPKANHKLFDIMKDS